MSPQTFCIYRTKFPNLKYFQCDDTAVSLHLGGLAYSFLRNALSLVLLLNFVRSNLNKEELPTVSHHLQYIATNQLHNLHSSSSELGKAFPADSVKGEWIPKSRSITAPLLSPSSGATNCVLNDSVSILPNHDGTDELRRQRRQIVPLPTTTESSPTQTADSPSFSPELERLIKLHTKFLSDFAAYKEWNRAQFVLPQDALSVCNRFTVELAFSKTSLFLNCTKDVSDLRKIQGYMPVVLAHFLNPTTQPKSPVDHRLLVNYSRRRPILVLAGNESLIELVERSQPEIERNYKWTVVKERENSPNRTANGELEVYHVFGFATTLTPLAQRIGVWSEVEGLDVDTAVASGVENFEGHKLRVTTVAGPPVVVLGREANNALIATGYLPDILDSLSLLLNFEFIMLTPADGKFGDVDQSGNWTGMVGMLQRNEADIALMSFSYTKTRQSAMDFSPPVEYSSTKLLVRRDRQVAEYKWDAFFRPFDWKVWATIPILITLGTITLIIFGQFNLLDTTPGENAWLLSTCFLLQGQSEHSTIRVTPFRITSGIFWLLSVFIFACYTARLTSFLAADTETLPVKDLAEAVSTKSWRIGLVRGSSFMERVKESKAKEMVLLWKRLQEDSSVLVGGFQEGINKAFNERYIFFTSELIPTFLVKGNCSYLWLPGNYFPGFGYMGYQKGLPYSAGISRMVAKIRETGQMRRLIKKWWGTSSTCSGRSGSDAFMAISLHETGSAFIILVIGVCLSASLMLLEFAFSVRRDNWQTTAAALQPNEFAAPIVHGTVSNFLPLLDNHQDRPFIWSIENKRDHFEDTHYLQQIYG